MQLQRCIVSDVDALDLIMLGRQLTKIGEEVMRGATARPAQAPPAGASQGGATPVGAPEAAAAEAPSMPTGPSLVLRDVFANPGSSITDITARTGLPQSYVSESVARLRGQGIVVTSADPADGRRTLVRVSDQHPRTVAAKGSAPVDAALAAALGEPAGGAAVTQIIGTLSALADRLAPETPGPIKRELDQARQELLDQARRR
jgi:DNA-binding MarR family transcriptional regulator